MLLSAALMSSSMVACGGPNVPDSTTTPPGNFKEAFAQLEARGELPVLDRTDTIAGIDANQNGVRGRHRSIHQQPARHATSKKRLYNLQRALNNAMLVDLKDKYRLREAANDVSRSVTCVSISYQDSAERPRRNLQIEKNDSKHPSALPCVHAVQQRAGRIGLHHGPGFCMSNV